MDHPLLELSSLMTDTACRKMYIQFCMTESHTKLWTDTNGSGQHHDFKDPG